MNEPATKDDARRLFASARWTFAKRYASFCPHWYTNRKDWDGHAFNAIVRMIHEQGEDNQWRGRKRKYLYPGDGFEYWVMDKPDEVEKTVIINRGRWPRDYES